MLNSCYGHNQSKGMGNDPVPESNLAMLTGISTFRFFFPTPSSLQLLILLSTAWGLTGCIQWRKKKKRKTHLIVDFVFALS